MSIRENLLAVRQRIDNAAKACGRNSDEITLIAVTKTHPAEMVDEAINAGAQDVGENKPQEVRDKYPKVHGKAKWHIIGHLQTNKVKYIIDKAELIHSVDSIHLMEEIDRQAKKCGRIQNILIQVNISGEESKSGIAPDELDSLLKKAGELDNIYVKGLMTIAPAEGDPKVHFRNMKKLFDEYSGKAFKNVEMKELSMGMSGDFEAAIECGATMVRVGSAIFGQRDYGKEKLNNIKIIEENHIGVADEFDIVIAGGGMSGIAAALAGARQKKSVLLIENSYILGGLATSGLVTIYLPLCDGYGKQVSFGICEELIRLSVKHCCEDKYCGAWLDEGSTEDKKEKRFEVRFNPHLFAMESEKLLLENGVKILYGTKICGVRKNKNRIEYIITENKSGRLAYKCNAAVDCTGDADLFAYAGMETNTFNAKNILASWYYYFSKGKVDLKMLGYSEDPDTLSENKPLVSRRFTGLDGYDNSEMVQLAHLQMLNDILKQRREDDTYVPVTMSTIPQLRMTRKIIGDYILDENEEHKHFESSIGMISNWKKRGPVYEIPFEALYSSKCENLFAAGRCISVTELMWDISRVIPACTVTGEAAGIAAALSTSSRAEIEKLQNILKNNNVVLHENDL